MTGVDQDGVPVMTQAAVGESGTVVPAGSVFKSSPGIKPSVHTERDRLGSLPSLGWDMPIMTGIEYIKAERADAELKDTELNLARIEVSI